MRYLKTTAKSPKSPQKYIRQVVLRSIIIFLKLDKDPPIWIIQETDLDFVLVIVLKTCVFELICILNQINDFDYMIFC